MYRLIISLFFLLVSGSVFSYVGPGAGISVLGSLLGILVTIGVAILAIVMWPIRKLMKKRKAARASNTEATVETDEVAENNDRA